MTKIRLIDLLCKYVNNRSENMPMRIRYGLITYEYTGLNYYNEELDKFLDDQICLEDLEYLVEILEETPPVIVEMTVNEYQDYLDWKMNCNKEQNND